MEEDDERAVMRVLITQMGLVMRTVADPAIRPQSMDSRVVSFELGREARRAVRVKKARVHSYPITRLVYSRLKGLLGK